RRRDNCYRSCSGSRSGRGSGSGDRRDFRYNPHAHNARAPLEKGSFFRKTTTPFISNKRLVKGDFLFPESIAGWRTKIQNCFCI
ncbi:MAG TPA: hypothetical protein PKK47_05325, partial [Smithellaceae bacterium]|nr:hypothetical protein [Smithellaceae bacterium]HPV72066.1 hypothetical protein [Smithellaceae bacterium]